MPDGIFLRHADVEPEQDLPQKKGVQKDLNGPRSRFHV